MSTTTRTGRPWAAAVQRGVAEALNARGAAAGCAPLAWSVGVPDDGWRRLGVPDGRLLLNGQVIAAHDYAAARRVAERWARELGLVEQDEPICEGTVEYRGGVDGIYVIVWAVVDGHTFGRSSS